MAHSVGQKTSGRRQVMESLTTNGLQSPRSWAEQLESFASESNNGYQLLGREELRNLPNPEWAIKGILPSRGVALLYGPSGSGKSFITFDLALAIAEGSAWFDHTVKKCPVVYIALEGQFGFRLRMEAWEQYHQRKIPASFKMVLQDFKLTNPSDLCHLTEVLPERAVTIIDTLNRASPMSDENLSSDMGMILEAAKKMQEKTDGLVLIVHHSGKSAAAGPRGHSSLFAGCDAILEVSRSGEHRKWSLAKAKEDQDGQSFPFTLMKIDLGKDDEGDELSSCVVQSASIDSIKSPKAKQPQGANQKIAFEIIQTLSSSGAHSHQSSLDVEYSYALKVVSENLNVPADRRMERAREAIDGLIAKGIVCCMNKALSVPA